MSLPDYQSVYDNFDPASLEAEILEGNCLLYTSPSPRD